MNVLKKYEEFAVFRGKIALFPLDVMPDIIEDCRKADLRIYGFDGFKLWDTYIQPFMEHSVDYSNIEDKQEIFRLSRDFILQRPTWA